jgi:multiple sugar transport system substrate-binding protein
VPITTYRPAYSVYPRISKEIQAATESIVTGSASPEEAAKKYDEQLKGIAGDDITSASGS